MCYRILRIFYRFHKKIIELFLQLTNKKLNEEENRIKIKINH